MKRFLYERMITELSKESKEELIQRIMSLEEIECSDRAFANECQAGSTIYNINELFSALDDLKEKFTYEKAARVYELAENAKSSWNFVKSEIAEINDNSRVYKVLDNFKNRVKSGEDSIQKYVFQLKKGVCIYIWYM